MKKNNYIEEELENISPFLAQLRQKETRDFEVPDGYFETIEDNIWARIKAEDEVESWGEVNKNSLNIPTLTWLQRAKYWLLRPQVGISFALILVVVVALNIFVNPTVNDSENILLTEEDINEYLEDNIDEFSESLLLEGASEELAEADILMEFNLDDVNIDAYLGEDSEIMDDPMTEEIW